MVLQGCQSEHQIYFKPAWLTYDISHHHLRNYCCLAIYHEYFAVTQGDQNSDFTSRSLTCGDMNAFRLAPISLLVMFFAHHQTQKSIATLLVLHCNHGITWGPSKLMQADSPSCEFATLNLTNKSCECRSVLQYCRWLEQDWHRYELETRYTVLCAELAWKGK